MRLCRCRTLAIVLVVCAAVAVQLLQDGTAARLGLFRLAARLRYYNKALSVAASKDFKITHRCLAVSHDRILSGPEFRHFSASHLGV